LLCGAATNSTGPFLGTFQDPRGCISRKKMSARNDTLQRNVSYFQLLMGYRSFSFSFCRALAPADPVCVVDAMVFSSEVEDGPSGCVLSAAALSSAMFEGGRRGESRTRGLGHGEPA